jgi:hypothetical protein
MPIKGNQKGDSEMLDYYRPEFGIYLFFDD